MNAVRNVHANVSLGCFGCAWSVFGLILLVFVVTHVSEIFAKLGALVR